MDGIDALLVFVGGFMAGAVNGVVGAGALISFPVLLYVGLTPLQANLATTFGVQPGFWTAAWNLRATYRELGAIVARLCAVAAAGGVVGAFVLLALPAEVFARLAPFLILGACVLIAIQPDPSTPAAPAMDGGSMAPAGSALWLVALWLVGVYTGYFGAGGAFLFVVVIRRYLLLAMHQVVAVRVLLSGVANLAAAIVFVFLAPVPWAAAIVLGVGSAVGGVVGARVSRRVPARALRIATVAIGCVIGFRLLVATG